MVNYITKSNIINDIIKVFSFSNNEKKARSEITFEFFDKAIKQINNIKKTIGIIITNDEIKIYFNTLLSFAAYILCQFPWWKRFVAATAMKNVNPAVKLGR